ncbi:hypothetical protein BpHYR1_015835 [Brachionus plicatilis]|uniref:Uncharacterized protein n=1 Tax=Brachionus plicatilis TaxID=10195 RepID=A0A3M7SPK5_BRAPC|nr:hypothetical protein BpHYR1_015835 [Brachionus plicatilis]
MTDLLKTSLDLYEKKLDKIGFKNEKKKLILHKFDSILALPFLIRWVRVHLMIDNERIAQII